MSLELILGGARSGKSRHAQARAAASALPVTVLVTAWAGDAEMAARIARHRAERPHDWQTVEAPHALAAAVVEHAAPDRCLLLDCLTLWLSNRLCAAAPDAAGLDDEIETLAAALAAAPGPRIVVSNEVGLGLVPEHPLGRAFRDHAGRLNQRIAELADHVVFIAAGLPLRLK